MTGAFDDDSTETTGARGLLGNGLPAVLQEATVVVKAPVGTTLDSIPAPRPPASEGELTAEEEKTLQACEAGMDNLHKAFWIAGKSLETMAAGNLHRTSGQPNFADFVWQKWEISESQVYRLMDEWRIGEALSQLGWHPRESQVRKLVDIKNAAGPRAAVAVYDAVARTGKRVTASLLEDVTRRLPPLTEESSPAEISQLVRGVLAPPAQPETAKEPDPAAETVGAAASGAVVNGTEAPVHTITTIGGSEDSPIGESTASASNPKGSSRSSGDLERLNEALALLREASRSLSKPGVRRALDANPAAASAVLAEIEDNLNKIGRAIAVRRPD